MTAERLRTAEIVCLLALWALPIPAEGAGTATPEPLGIRVGPQTVVMEDAIFPYMTTTREGTIIVVGTVLRPNPESYTGPNYPRDIPRTVRSADGGKTWELWYPTEEQGDGPIISGCTLQLRSGRILIFDYYSRFIGDGRFQGQVWHSDDQWQTVTPSPYIAHVPRAKPNLGDDRGDTVPTGILWHRTILEMPNGNLLAGNLRRLQGGRHAQPVPAQHETVPRSLAPLNRRGQELVLRLHHRRWPHGSGGIQRAGDRPPQPG